MDERRRLKRRHLIYYLRVFNQATDQLIGHLVDLTTEGTLTVPLSAVVNPGASQPYIFIYHQGRVAKRPVTVEDIIQDRIIIHGDIAEGDQVVTTGQSQLADGDDVEVAS